MHEAAFVELEALFVALGDKTRLRLLALMADGPVAVGFLADRLGESQPKISRHLATLRNAGLVSTTRDGKWIYYEIRYPKDSARRRILESLMDSIAVVHIGGESVYLAEGASDDTYEQNIYVETDMSDTLYGSRDDELVENERELDIFLL
jgi:DNA-binding transcriptional ArsR family regulator